MRPCKHTRPDPRCYSCQICADAKSDKARRYRERWGEPHPGTPEYLERVRKRYSKSECKHLGELTGEQVQCGQCGSEHSTVSVNKCLQHGECTIDKVGRRVNEENIARYLPCCKHCKQYEPGDSSKVANEITDPLPNPPLTDRRLAYMPAVRETHKKALLQLAETDFPPPDKCEGRGVVICGGDRYWPMLVMSLRMLRDVSDLPVQVWYRGGEESINLHDVKDLKNITFHDAWAVNPKPRILRGWETKSLAILHSGLAEVLFLDADAYAIRDPLPLFDLLRDKGMVYWKNHAETGTVRWNMNGLDNPGLAAVQGGQYLVNRKLFWREINLAYWIDQHSDYWYEYQYGDQDSWRVALAATKRTDLVMQLSDMRWIKPAWICAHEGNDYFVHRCGGKFWLDEEPTYYPEMPEEDKVFGYLAAMDFDRYETVREIVGV